MLLTIYNLTALMKKHFHCDMDSFILRPCINYCRTIIVINISCRLIDNTLIKIFNSESIFGNFVSFSAPYLG